MTKYYDEQHKSKKEDTPIPISGEEFTKSDNIEFICSFCQCRLIKMSEDEYYCNRCSISQYPDIESVRSKSRITTPIGLNLEPCLSYTPDPNEAFFKDKSPEIKGGLKLLKDRGLKVTNYKEGFG